MGFTSRQVTLTLQYSKADCMAAATAALNELGFPIKSWSDTVGTIVADVKMALTSGTWGDILTISVSEIPSGGCSMTVDSSTKIPTLLAGDQQSKNIQRFADALQAALTRYEPVATGAAPSPSVGNVADEIKQLKELLDLGAITQEDYDAKKKQLLGL